jgi:hypothetical protein
MPKSQQAGKVDQVQAALHDKLRGLGFRKQARTFNRTTEDGLMQVVNVQMGAHDPPGTTYIPGLRENLYGWFTVNLGVYVPEVARLHGGGEAKGFVREYHCCVRDRLGPLGPERKDLWWRNDAVEEVVPDLLARLDRDGLPFLARFATRDAILREWKDKSENQSAGGSPPRIVMAIILAERGDKAAATELLAAQAEERRNPGHPAYVRSLAARLGIALPEDE